MQQHQRREVQDWLNLFEQQKQSGLNVFEYVTTCLDEMSKPNVDVELRLPRLFAKR